MSKNMIEVQCMRVKRAWLKKPIEFTWFERFLIQVGEEEIQRKTKSCAGVLGKYFFIFWVGWNLKSWHRLIMNDRHLRFNKKIFLSSDVMPALFLSMCPSNMKWWNSPSHDFAIFFIAQTQTTLVQLLIINKFSPRTHFVRFCCFGKYEAIFSGIHWCTDDKKQTCTQSALTEMGINKARRKNEKKIQFWQQKLLQNFFKCISKDFILSRVKRDEVKIIHRHEIPREIRQMFKGSEEKGVGGG